MKTGQTVKIVTGRDKGKTGKIIQVLPKLDRVVVEGVNKMFKHVKNRATTRGRRTTKGERVEFFGPIHRSNVRLSEEAKAAPVKSKAGAKPAAKSS
ncbi:MAG: 50S ribosomal protein L24 [Parcubacteria group bacterium]|nr:50S ribosomal protein L24 [Parcubacteria group bacterium]